ncbi:hypothetical protein FRC08_013321 [Ceratobasidium sp. 394]|nr:hypothetical protein FRC08_013321 [Ceratobasidium sp. 394]
MRRLEAKAREEAEERGIARTRVLAPSYLVKGEEGRLAKWAEIVSAIPSSWKA